MGGKEKNNDTVEKRRVQAVSPKEY